MPENLITPLVLAGAGHSHLVTLRHWLDHGYRPPRGTVLISPEPDAWYSGMMPGLAAGRFRAVQCAIDLGPWCRALGLELRIGKVSGIDAGAQTLELACGERLGYRLLSLNTGALNPGPESDGSLEVVPAKPFAGFEAAWERWQRRPPARLGILGGGPAAFELGLALRRNLRQTELTLISGSPLLHGHPKAMRKHAYELLERRDIRLREHIKADAIVTGRLVAAGKPVAELDALVLASGAAAPAWLRGAGLTCDEHGFARVDPTLRSLSHPSLLASGDCAALPGAARSGVYAVRQGSVLAHNIPALLEGRPLHLYHPQPRALALLSTADGGALMGYGPLSFSGRLPGLLKDRLDLGFMRRHRLAAGRLPDTTNG